MDNIQEVPFDAEQHAAIFDSLITPESEMLAKEDAKQSAKNKLSALGLTEEEILALIG